MTSPTPIDPSGLPDVVRSYLAAHEARETDAALSTFGPDAVVVDDGRTYRGREVVDFLDHAGSRYSYTTELVGAQQLDETRWVAVNRLEGDFPGSVVELGYRFTVSDDRIAELVIAPVTPPS